MKVKYQLSEEDYIAFNKYHLNHSKVGKQKLLIVRWIGPVLFSCAVLLHALILGFDSIFMMVMMVMSVFWYYWYPARVEKEVGISVKKMLAEGDNKSFLAEQTLELLEIGAVLSNTFETQTMNWSTFIKVEKTDEHIFLFKSPIMAIVIPYQAFNKEKDYQEFYDYLIQKIKENI